MTTTISAARLALFNLLEDEFPELQVTYGPPTALEEQEVVALMGVTDSDEEWAQLGAQRRAETYDIEVHCKFTRRGSGAKEAAEVDEGGWALADRVRDVVHSNLTLSDTVTQAQVRQKRSDGVLPIAGGGWGTIVVLSVGCMARIRSTT